MSYTMLTIPDDLLEDMEEGEFVKLAARILGKHGSEYGQGRRYHDEWVDIRTHYNGLGLEVTRQKQNDKVGQEGFLGRRSHLSVSNPTTMVTEKGEVIRHHGEHIYLVWHMKQLMEI